MTKSDKTSIIIGLTILVVGILLCIADFLWWKTSIKLWISIGCSLIASAVVVILNGFFVYRIKVSSLDSWKIHKIYEKRSFKDSDSDPAMKKMKEGSVDAIAFGLSSFRSNKIKIVDELLNRGVCFRILTMDPDGKFIDDQDVYEGNAIGDTKKKIKELVSWADEKNKEYQGKGRITVKGYNCLPLDFYWRDGDVLFIGPYWQGHDSSDTITYSFKKGGTGYQMYSEYFEKIWANKKVVKQLTA